MVTLRLVCRAALHRRPPPSQNAPRNTPCVSTQIAGAEPKSGVREVKHNSYRLYSAGAGRSRRYGSARPSPGMKVTVDSISDRSESSPVAPGGDSRISSCPPGPPDFWVALGSMGL